METHFDMILDHTHSHTLQGVKVVLVRKNSETESSSLQHQQKKKHPLTSLQDVPADGTDDIDDNKEEEDAAAVSTASSAVESEWSNQHKTEQHNITNTSTDKSDRQTTAETSEPGETASAAALLCTLHTKLWLMPKLMRQSQS